MKNGRSILTRISQLHAERMWTGFIWLMTEPDVGSYNNGNEPSRFIPRTKLNDWAGNCQIFKELAPFSKLLSDKGGRIW
jgi:hypothetical protein